MNTGSGSLWSWMDILTLRKCAISPDSISLPLMTSTCCISVNPRSGDRWWRTQSWSMNAMSIAPQSISTSIITSCSFTVSIQIITNWFPSIDPSNTSTLLTDKCDIPKHRTAFKRKLLSSTEQPSSSDWLDPILVPWNLSRFLLLWPC